MLRLPDPTRVTRRENLIDLHLHQTLPPDSPENLVRVVASRWIVADHAGVLDPVEPPDKIDRRIRRVDMSKRPGDRVTLPTHNSDRIGCVMAVAPTRDEAEQAADEYVRSVRLKIASPISDAAHSNALSDISN